MIVAGAEGFVRSQYRKFNIKSADLAPGDDYAMMREVLTRRFKRLVLEESEALDEGVRPCGSDPTSCGIAGEGFAEEGEEETASRIEAPTTPPLTERGADAIAFGVLRADDADQGVRPGGSDPTMDVEEDDEVGVLPDRPDLVLIDGGAGQLSVACEALAELGVSDVTLVGVAKGPDRDAGREHIHMKGRTPFMLEPRDPVLYFIQRLRDEAHRFAIGTHRAKRSKAIGANPLDEIAGIGPTRKRALLAHFGSAKAVSRAGVEDLKAVAGISAEMAQKIYDFFHERKS
jgi:excinuclease ABC subunit C